MKRFWSVLIVLFLFACGDDSVSSNVDDYSSVETSSSSVNSSSAVSSSSEKGSSSSAKPKSSSSEESSSSEKKSSSVETSSSSEASSSSVVESSSSEPVASSSSVEANSSSENSSSSELSSSSISSSSISSSSVSSSSVEESSSSSYYFVIPEGPAKNVYTLSLAEVKQNVQNTMDGGLFSTDTFEIKYTMRGNASGMTYGADYYFVSKGKDQCYYEQSLDTDYSKKTRIVINGDRRKVIFFDGTSTRLLATEQSYTDSVRKVLGMPFKNPLDSLEWKEPVQVDDSIFRVTRYDGAELYYNANKKGWELYMEQYISDDGDIVDAEYRLEYKDGVVVKQNFLAIIHSGKLGRDISSAVTITSLLFRSSATFPDRLFEL